MSEITFPANWFDSVKDVERWAENRVSPAWRKYHQWRRRTPAATRQRGVTSGEWPPGTPHDCVALHLRLTARERITGAVFGDYPPIAVVLARDPDAVQHAEAVWRRELLRQDRASNWVVIASQNEPHRRDSSPNS